MAEHEPAIGQAVPKANSVRPSEPAPALDARGLSIAYNREVVVADVDLAVPRCGVTALCGPNGSGKSSLLNALAGLHPPCSGEVYLDGDPLARLSRRELAARVAYLPQQPVVPSGLTVREVVSLARYPHRNALGTLNAADRQAVTRALRRAEVADLTERDVDQLSGGERQRVWVALVLAQQADILLLDEPTTFLDPQHQVGVLSHIRHWADELGLTVVWVLHDLNQAATYSDRLVLLKGGHIAASGPPEAVLTEATVRDVFNLDALIMPHPETGQPLCIPRS